MNIKLNILLICSLILGAMSCTKPADKPNLLFVFTDQQSYDMLGVAGNSQVLTPNLDKFGDEGYAAEDFMKLYEQGFNWKENYTQRPIDVLKRK